MLNFFNQFYCIEGDPVPMSASKMEFFEAYYYQKQSSYQKVVLKVFAELVGKHLCGILLCLKESHLRCDIVSESAFHKKITAVAFLL